ncbi:DUF4112 domain-containing protein [Roseomonas sp. CCTCC AB2023176]|uniref:DUF4112 domain-containing protein n=1 Tax=Roseomonas sp. CCTCC AB2023176 TaxID=3342640 RepID=UPI0035D56F4B
MSVPAVPSIPLAFRGLSAAERVARVERLARLLDSAVRIPFTPIRFGADAALNVIPGLGTAATIAMSAWIIWEAHRLGVPKATLLRMAANVGLDSLVSAVPVLGWVGDVFLRSNLRNLRLLKDHVAVPR